MSVEERPRRFPRLGLPSYRAVELTIRGKREPGEGWLARYVEKFRDDPVSGGTAFLSITRYTTRGGDEHTIVAAFSRDAETSTEIDVLVAYSVGSGIIRNLPRIPRLLRREGEFLQMAIELGTFPELKASVRFRFNEPSVSDLSFPLPSWIGNPDKEDAFEIRGVRGAKFSSGQRQEPEFTFTLDRPLSRDVFVNVEFDFADPISSGVFRKSLSHGRTLSRQLVFTEEDPA